MRDQAIKDLVGYAVRTGLIEESDRTWAVNALLEAMRLNGVKKLFFASTSAVYGEQMGREVSEDAVALRPISYYGGCKLGSLRL